MKTYTSCSHGLVIQAGPRRDSLQMFGWRGWVMQLWTVTQIIQKCWILRLKYCWPICRYICIMMFNHNYMVLIWQILRAPQSLVNTSNYTVHYFQTNCIKTIKTGILWRHSSPISTCQTRWVGRKCLKKLIFDDRRGGGVGVQKCSS